MKLFKVSAFTLLTIILVSVSCTKEIIRETPAKVTHTIEGLWTGTYTVDGLPAQGSLFQSLVVYTDGSIVTKGKGGDNSDHFSKGTWVLGSDSLFTATITTFYPNSTNPITQRITAKFTKDGTLVDGTWTDTVNPFGLKKGKYSTLTEVN